MNTHWYVVKHVPDLIRREPRNIGVILIADDQHLSRFLGEQEDGDIDGRTVPQFGNHLIYKAWVKHWRELTSQGSDALNEQASASRKPGASFYIEAGGEQLLGQDDQSSDDLLEDLFVTLVRPETDSAIADDVRSLTNKVFRQLGLSRKVKQRVSLPVTLDGIPDELWFDYRYDNGRPHLMQRVGLASADKSTWDRLHTVETNFERLRRSQQLPDFSAIAFVKQQDTEPRLVEAVNGRLGVLAQIVDVSDLGAADRLDSLLNR